MITTRDIAWAAGFYEGEGSVMFHWRLVRVEIQQTQQWVLEKMRDLFGGTIYLRKKPVKGGRQVTWQWQIGGAHAAGVMMTLYSFLSPRRQYQVRDVLAKWRQVPTNMKAIIAQQRLRDQRRNDPR